MLQKSHPISKQHLSEKSIDRTRPVNRYQAIHLKSCHKPLCSEQASFRQQSECQITGNYHYRKLRHAIKLECHNPQRIHTLPVSPVLRPFLKNLTLLCHMSLIHQGRHMACQAFPITASRYVYLCPHYTEPGLKILRP